eukprot:scaffold21979_cov66-Phaeocystis_antarctica.AAC.1
MTRLRSSKQQALWLGYPCRTLGGSEVGAAQARSGGDVRGAGRGACGACAWFDRPKGTLCDQHFSSKLLQCELESCRT